jgi:hypothetical protein
MLKSRRLSESARKSTLLMAYALAAAEENGSISIYFILFYFFY